MQQPRRPQVPQDLDLSISLRPAGPSSKVNANNKAAEPPKQQATGKASKAERGKDKKSKKKAANKSVKSDRKDAVPSAGSTTGSSISADTFDADELKGEYVLDIAKKADCLILQEVLKAYAHVSTAFMNITDATLDGEPVSPSRLEELMGVHAPKNAPKPQGAAPGNATAAGNRAKQGLVQMRVAAATRLGQLHRTPLPAGLVEFAATLFARNDLQATWKVRCCSQ
jgi:hypothetical protein